LNIKLRGIILALLGLVLLGAGGVAVFLLFLRVNTPAVEVQPTPIPVVKTSVVVASHDIFLGELLGQEDLALIEVPVETAPRDALATIEEALDRFTRVDLVQGEMILSHNLADPTNVNHDLAYILDDNHVLLAFPAEDLMSQQSIIQRGDIVDILATVNIAAVNTAPEAATESMTTEQQIQQPTEEETILTQNVTVDAYQGVTISALVADIVVTEEQQEQDPISVTNPPDRNQIIVQAYLLSLPPQDALLLKYLIDAGAIFDMVIRAPTSTEEFELTPITSEYLTELYGLGIIPK